MTACFILIWLHICHPEHHRQRCANNEYQTSGEETEKYYTHSSKTSIGFLPNRRWQQRLMLSTATTTAIKPIK